MDLSPATTLVKAYQSGSGPLTAMVLRDKAIYYANAGMEEDGLLVDSTIVLVKLVFQMQLDLAQRIAPGTALSRKFGTDPSRILRYYLESYAELLDGTVNDAEGRARIARLGPFLRYMGGVVDKIQTMHNVTGQDPTERRLAELRESRQISWEPIRAEVAEAG